MRTNVKIYQREENQAVIVHVGGERVELEKVTERGRERLRLGGKKPRTRRALAAACLVAAAMIWEMAYALSTPWEERAYNRYYERYEEETMFLDNVNDFSWAKKNYLDGKTEDAWYILKNLNAEYSRKNTLLLYKALVLMDGGSYNLAIEMFDLALSTGENRYLLGTTSLYKGLCYLRLDDIDMAMEELSKVQRENLKEYQKAQKILKRIKKHLND